MRALGIKIFSAKSIYWALTITQAPQQALGFSGEQDGPSPGGTHNLAIN